MSNFRAVCASLQSASAALSATNATDAGSKLLALLADGEQRAALSRNCRQWLTANQGATERTLQYLLQQA